MTKSSVNSYIWSNIPTELAHIILLFTGKFILDKNNKLKSIVNLHDFENIKQHLNVFELFFDHYLLRVNKMEKFIMYLHKKVYNRPVMNEKERKREEMLGYMGVNYNRHSLLFTKPSALEEVMIPIENGVFCEDCQNNLTSVELEKKQNRIINLGFVYHNEIMYPILDHEWLGMIFWHGCEKKGYCRSCKVSIEKKRRQNIIKKEKEENEEKEKEKEKVITKYPNKYLDNKKLPKLKCVKNVRMNNKKTFRMLR